MKQREEQGKLNEHCLLLLPSRAHRDPGGSGVNNKGSRDYYYFCVNNTENQGSECCPCRTTPSICSPGRVGDLWLLKLLCLVQRRKPSVMARGETVSGADVVTAVKHPQPELANPTLLKIAALFILIQDLGNFQCILGG